MVTAQSDNTGRFKGLDDKELLSRSASDPEAFGEFFVRHSDLVLRFFARRTACAEAAADLTAETFAAAFLSRRKYRPGPAPASAWVLSIARHKLADSIRKGARERSALQKLGIDPPALDDDSFERIEAMIDAEPLRLHLREAMAELPEDIASAVYLRVGCELPYSDIASRLSCSEGAARVRVMRGLDSLVNAMEVG